MEDIEADQGDYKHNPARELMKEAERFFRMPVLNAASGPYDTRGVGSDGNGNTCEGKDNAPSGGALQKVAIENGQREEAHQRADSATGLCDFELHHREFNDVSLQQDRHSKQRKNHAG